MKSIKRIVFILPGSGRSGGVKSTVTLANHLLGRGYEVRILCRAPEINSKYLYKSILYPIIFKRSYDWLHEFNGEIQYFKDLNKVLFKKNEIIIGAGMWSSTQLINLDIKSNFKLQYLHGEHIVNPKETQKVLKSSIPKIVIASFLKNLVESNGGKVLGIVPNGIDTNEYYCSVDENEKDGIGAIYASHVAKDPETLIAVLGGLSKKKPGIPIRVFSPHRRPKEIDGKNFWRLPSLEKSREIYSKSLVWIMASRSEGFSIPVLEAMACGCAVVATDCGGPKDIICDGENGFIVEVGNIEQIIERVLMLLDKREIRENLRKKSIETIRNFSWEIAANKMEDVLDKLIDYSL